MRFVILVTTALYLVSCGSKEEKPNVSLEEAPKMEKELQSGTGDKREKVGVKDDTVKIQKVMYLEEEFNKLKEEIEDLEGTIYGKSKKDPGGIYLELNGCRKRLADQRIGGSGAPEPMEKWEKISEADESYNYHVDKNKNVVAVREEQLADRIASLKKTRKVLHDRFDSFKDKLEGCQMKYRTALINHGLNPDDTQAQGEWVEGANGYRVWRQKRPTTSDPEELMKRKAEREKTTQGSN